MKTRMPTQSNVVALFALTLLAGTAQAQSCLTSNKIIDLSPFNDGRFGESIKLAWDGLGASPLLAIGEPGRDLTANDDNRGALRIYQYTAGAWTNTFTTNNITGSDGERLGKSVGMSDRFAIAGAPGYSSNNGRVHIFSRPNYSNPFAFESYIAGPSNPSDSQFGSAAAISTQYGGWCVVGAPMYGPASAEFGAAYVYTRQAGGTWSQAFQLVGSDNGASSFEHRGQSVAISQSTPYAAVGAPNGEDAGQPADHGVVTIIERLNNGQINPSVANVRPPTPEAAEHFGAAVAIEDTFLVVGAPDEDLSLFEGGSPFQAIDCGAIYLFQKGANGWQFVTKLRSSAPTTNGHFGASVATDTSRIVVSEPGTKRVHVFRYSNGNWQHQAVLSDPDNASSGSFGTSVAIYDDHIVTGDAQDDHTFAVNPGAVYTTQLGNYSMPGDSCDDPMRLSFSDYTGCTQLATPSAGTVTTCGNGGGEQGNDVWFEFVPTCDGNIILDTFGSDFDTILSVHSTCPNLGGTNTITCNDDASFPAPNNRASLVTFNFTGGQTYLIRVSGYAQANGQFVLRHSEYYAGTSNDTCLTAEVVGYGTTQFNSCQANTERTYAAQCAPANGTPYNDVWFKFVSPNSGGVRVSTCGSSFDTVLSVFAGPTCPADSPFIFDIACNDDSEDLCGASQFSVQSRTTFLAQTGQTYFIQVCGYTPDEHGPGQLTIEPYAHCNDIDFNNDGSSFDPQDIDAFLSVYSEGPCIPADAECDYIDFNNDTSIFDPCDIDSFLLVFSEGPCTSCGQ
ncbi:MAG: hypothetical protein U0640_15505 [Phycisphaerales bacterium]